MLESFQHVDDTRISGIVSGVILKSQSHGYFNFVTAGHARAGDTGLEIWRYNGEKYEEFRCASLATDTGKISEHDCHRRKSGLELSRNWRNIPISLKIATRNQRARVQSHSEGPPTSRRVPFTLPLYQTVLHGIHDYTIEAEIWRPPEDRTARREPQQRLAGGDQQVILACVEMFEVAQNGPRQILEADCVFGSIT